MPKIAIDTSNLGLRGDQVIQLQKEHGFNEIQREKARSAWLLLFEQFKSPLVVILVFACVVSLILSEGIEAFAIGSILILNALIGFFQEYKAETSIAALEKMTAPKAKVRRDGKLAVILARDIVPGDLLTLEAGDIIAADAKLVECSQFLVNEAILTGESMPVTKSSGEDSREVSTGESVTKIFMGTSVAAGTSTAVVTSTGMKTELGKIANLLATAHIEPTPLQTQLARIGKHLLFICFFVVVLVAVIGYLQGITGLELLIFSLSLAVAAVPEGMPAIVTVALALGVRRMANKNALIRKLPVIETLGSISVICTDKTGTLTTGKMRVRELWGDDQTKLLKAAASCCDAELDPDGLTGTGDPTEIAILIAALEKGFQKKTIEIENPRISSQAFDSVRKRMSVFRKDELNYFKGAIESLSPLCGENREVVASAINHANEMSARGLRVLAVAIGTGPEEKNLKLMGLIAFADPPRAEVFQAIKEARSAGITLIMITGDHPKTAATVALELGLVLDGEDLESRVHARATPEDKLKLIRLWKSKGAIVAMTGDGVNDAPALKEAHVGIAMGMSGTEVTRQAADLILADDNFATIIAAIKEGRGIFQNIRKAITYLLTGNFAEIVLVLGAISFGLPLPLLAAHLLWINLVTDALPALTLIADPLSPNLMQRKPRGSSEQIMGRQEWTQVVWIGLLEAAVVLGVYWYLQKEYDAVYARNFTFTTFVFSQMFRAFSARSRTRTLWEVGASSNLWMLMVVVLTGVIQLSLHFLPLSQIIFGLSPLSASDLLFILPFALVPVSVIEMKKIVQQLLHKSKI